jgi:hypothetical protein
MASVFFDHHANKKQQSADSNDVSIVLAVIDKLA